MFPISPEENSTPKNSSSLKDVSINSMPLCQVIFGESEVATAWQSNTAESVKKEGKGQNSDVYMFVCMCMSGWVFVHVYVYSYTCTF